MGHDDAFARFGIIGGEIQQALALCFSIFKVAQQLGGIGPVIVVAGIFFLGFVDVVCICDRYWSVVFFFVNCHYILN
jgi:hypothetical protein